MLWHPSCAGWHGTSSSNWFSTSTRGFYRGDNGVFSFIGGNGTWTSSNYCGRGVAVIGTGL